MEPFLARARRALSLPTLAASLAVLGLAVLGSAQPARAASCSATVEDLDFGSLDTLGAAAAETASRVSIACDSIAPQVSELLVCVHLGSGSSPATGADRRIPGPDAGAPQLGYRLFADPARQIPWGSVEEPALGAPRAVVLPAREGAAAASVILYAWAPAGQRELSAGLYSSSFSGLDSFLTVHEGENGDCARRDGAVQALDFSVRARVEENCLVATQDIQFGRHGLLTGPVDARGGIAISCTPGAAFTVALNAGLGGSGDPARRIMSSGSDTLLYGLFQDEARSRPFGSEGDLLAHGTGTRTDLFVPVYGRVPQQPVVPGTYSDIVGVTVTYGPAP